MQCGQNEHSAFPPLRHKSCCVLKLLSSLIIQCLIHLSNLEKISICLVLSSKGNGLEWRTSVARGTLSRKNLTIGREISNFDWGRGNWYAT